MKVRLPWTTLPALDDRIDTRRLRAPRPFQYSANVHPADLSDVRPRVTPFAQHKCLAANVFQGFGRKLAGVDLFHARIISESI